MPNATLAPLGQVAIGPRAARTLVAELARHTGPKTGLLVTVGPDSPVLAAAIDALLPEDRLTVVALEPAPIQAHPTERGSSVAVRARAGDPAAPAEPAG